MPEWLTLLAVASLSLGGLCALVIAADIFLAGQRQHMWIMEVVWPVTGLYAGPLALWAYFKLGRKSTHAAMKPAMKKGKKPGQGMAFWQSVAVGATHCGAGCTLGDIVAEWFTYLVPLSLWGRPIFAAWGIDYVLAFSFGIAFQYFTIKPARQLSPSRGLIAALKADTLSLTSWQVGMYGWMAVATWAIFRHELPKTDPVFWFMMQIAMLAGFITAYPVNWWLIKQGIKEKM
jgi:hypothetical protein